MVSLPLLFDLTLSWILIDSLDFSQPGELNFQRLRPNLSQEPAASLPSSCHRLLQYGLLLLSTILRLTCSLQTVNVFARPVADSTSPTDPVNVRPARLSMDKESAVTILKSSKEESAVRSASEDKFELPTDLVNGEYSLLFSVASQLLTRCILHSPSPQVFNQMTQKCGTCPPGDITTSSPSFFSLIPLRVADTPLVDGACIRRSCPAGQEPLANGECPPACLADKHGICCASPNTVYDGSCVPPCGYGQTRGPYGCQWCASLCSPTFLALIVSFDSPTGTEWKSSKCEPTAPPAPPAPKGLPKGSRCVLSSECASLICIQAGTLFVSVSTCF